MTTDTKQKKNFSKTANILILCLSILIFICLVTGEYLLGAFGRAISGFFLGTFGLAFFGVLLAGIIVPTLLLSGVKISTDKKSILSLVLLYVSIVLLVHCITSSIYIDETASAGEFGKYLANCYNFYSYPSFGGVTAGIIVFPVVKTLTWFSYVLFVLLMTGMVFYSALTLNKAAIHAENAKHFIPEEQTHSTLLPQPTVKEDVGSSQLKKNLEILYGDSAQKPEEQPAPQVIQQPTVEVFPTAPVVDFGQPTQNKEVDESFRIITARPEKVITGVLDADALAQQIRNKKNSQPEELLNNSAVNRVSEQPSSTVVNLFSDNKVIQEEKPVPTQPEPRIIQTTQSESKTIQSVQPEPAKFIDEDVLTDNFVEENTEESNFDSVTDETYEEQEVAEQPIPIDIPIQAAEQEFVSPVETIILIEDEVTAEDKAPIQKESGQSVVFGEQQVEITPDQVGVQVTFEIKGGKEEHRKPIHQYKRYIAPTVDLLDDAPQNMSIVAEDYEENGRKLVQLLAEFRIVTEVENIVVAPAVTRYEMKLAPGISVKRVTALADDISMGLSAKSSVRIEAPIPSTPLFGIEVPNKISSTVSLKEVLDSAEFYNNKGALAFALGIDIGGRKIIGDLADMPHLLVSGTTGTGKSVCLNNIITSLMFRYSPEELRFILVDPKNVEFFLYDHCPHLLIDSIICDADRCVTAMNWLVDEMESRYQMFRNIGVKDITGYNRIIDRTKTQLMPRIVLIIDELNDLMSIKKAEIEGSIKRLSQKARAAGIHLVFATQRPSTDVITGVIKANLPCRIALKTISATDSITILAEGGAEKLIGRGDMLYLAPLASGPVRLQGAYVTIGEVEKVVEFVSRYNEAYFDEDISNIICKDDHANGNGLFDEDENLDVLFQEVLHYICTLETTSISMLQRRFSIGYNRAGKLIETLTAKNFISGFDGSKARRVIITQEDYDKMFNE